MSKKVTSADIYRALWQYFADYKYQLQNTYIFTPGTGLPSWESDFFCVKPDSGYMIEVEVKVSRSDFKADFKKGKHEVMLKALSGTKIYTVPNNFNMKGEYSGVSFVRPARFLPNRFYYACPTGIIKPEELPPYAGLITLESAWQWHLIKKAPLIHKENNLIRYRPALLEKFYWEARDQKAANRDLKHYKDQHKQKEQWYDQVLRAHGIDPGTGLRPEDTCSTSPFGRQIQDFTDWLVKKLKLDLSPEQKFELLVKFMGKHPGRKPIVTHHT